MNQKNFSTTNLNTDLKNNQQIDDYEYLIVKLKKIKNIISLFAKSL